MSGVNQWSQTAASNATADPTVNWAEGQAPNTVNDSARALMASVAKWRDDLAGSLTTTGTSSAYVLASNQSFTSLSALGGQLIAFRAHLTNASSPTLSVDGLGAKTLTTDGSTGLPTGTFVAGTIYVASYDSSLAVFRVVGLPGSGVGFPAGTLMLFQQSSAPTGWVRQTTHDDKVLRIVAGSPSFGGLVPFSTILTTIATASFTISQANLPNYNLSLAGVTVSGTNGQVSGFNTNVGTTNTYRASDGTGGGVSQTPSWSGTIGGTLPSGGSGTSLTAPIDLRLTYVDCIIAAKS